MTWQAILLFIFSALIGRAAQRGLEIFVLHHDLDPKFASSPWIALQVDLMVTGLLSIIAAAVLGIVLQARRLVGRRRLDRRAPVAAIGS